MNEACARALLVLHSLPRTPATTNPFMTKSAIKNPRNDPLHAACVRSALTMATTPNVHASIAIALAAGYTRPVANARMQSNTTPFAGWWFVNQQYAQKIVNASTDKLIPAHICKNCCTDNG